MSCLPGAAARGIALTVIAIVTFIACGLFGSATASAHAQLLETSPISGSTVPTQPRDVIFKFNQNVGGTLGAVRVYNAQGDEVDDLDVTHPNGNEHWMGVGLKPQLPDGTYTATYRVISADTHIVYGGLVFNIGHAGATPKVTVAGLIERNEAGEVTKVAFGVVRTLNYLALALTIGGLAFALLAWRHALETVPEGDPQRQAVAAAFAARLAWLLASAVVVGAIVSVLGVLLQGASAAGVSLWSSLKSSVIDNTLQSRFGEVWGLRAIDWVLLGGLLLIVARTQRAGKLAAVRPPRGLVVLLALGCAYLAITPALAGHASVQGPTGVFLPADVIHVLAASVWVGGIACLLLALPAATRRLQGPRRSELLLTALARFSPIALASVVAIAATGIIQAYIDVRSLQSLLHTTYGALIIAKTLLLLVLIAVGWVNRGRIIPALSRLAGTGRPPGAVGMRARRTLRGEFALMICVLGVTAALVSYAPPIDAASGPFSTNTTIGPAELEMTVEPAKVGLNTAHLYLIDAKTGAQFTATKELTVTAKLPAKGIGPLPLHSYLAGPGHYILSSAALSPSGTWNIEITDRVSEFEEYSRVVKVPIR